MKTTLAILFMASTANAAITYDLPGGGYGSYNMTWNLTDEVLGWGVGSLLDPAASTGSATLGDDATLSISDWELSYGPIADSVTYSLHVPETFDFVDVTLSVQVEPYVYHVPARTAPLVKTNIDPNHTWWETTTKIDQWTLGQPRPLIGSYQISGPITDVIGAIEIDIVGRLANGFDHELSDIAHYVNVQPDGDWTNDWFVRNGYAAMRPVMDPIQHSVNGGLSLWAGEVDGVPVDLRFWTGGAKAGIDAHAVHVPEPSSNVLLAMAAVVCSGFASRIYRRQR